MIDGDAIGAGGSVTAARTGDDQADRVGTGTGVNMSRVLLGRGRSVTKAPLVTVDGTGGKAGEGHRQIVLTTGLGSGERGHWRRRGHGDATGTGGAVRSPRTDDGQGDVVGARFGVGVTRVLQIRGVSIAKVPRPDADGAGGLVLKSDGQRVVPLTVATLEVGDRCRMGHGDAIGAFRLIRSSGSGCEQGHGVGARRRVNVNRICFRGSLAIAEVPKVISNRSLGCIREGDSQIIIPRRRRRGEAGARCGMKNRDAVAAGQAVAAPRALHRQGNAVGTGGSVDVLRTLFGRGAAVTKIPHPAVDGTTGSIRKLHGEVVGSAGRIERERRLWSRVLDVDAITADLRVFSTGTSDGQGDRKESCFSVGMGRALFCREISVAEIPQPLGDGTGGLIGELHRQSRFSGSGGRSECGDGCRFRNSDAIGARQ